MRSSPEGLVPSSDFLQQAMAPRPSFNDGSNPGMTKNFEYYWKVEAAIEAPHGE
jgi:hypothetical protein